MTSSNMSLSVLANSEEEDEPGERPVAGTKRASSNAEEQPSKRSREESQVGRLDGQFIDHICTFSQTSIPQFAVPLSGVSAVFDESIRTAMQLKCQRMCDWNK
jgi:hypothetical protein